VQLAETKRGVIANALEKWLFLITSPTIITKTILRHKIPEFSTDCQNFKQFLKTPKYSFETETEIAQNTLAVAKKKDKNIHWIPATSRRFAKSEVVQLDKKIKKKLKVWLWKLLLSASIWREVYTSITLKPIQKLKNQYLFKQSHRVQYYSKN
jgi:hypothetical protein